MKFFNVDGWKNLFTGKGVAGVDKQTGYQISGNDLLSEETCRSIYRGDGWGKKIVNRIASDMTRAWITVNQDTNGAIISALSALKTKKKFYDALIWAKVFGGSIIIMIIDDGSSDLSEPLNEKAIKRIDSLRVYDRFRVVPISGDGLNPSKVDYLEPKIYEVTPSGQASFNVHESRVLRFDGILTDDATLKLNQGWHESIFGAIQSQLSDLAGAYHSAKDVIDDFIQTILKVNGLQDMIAGDQEGLIKKRLEIIDLGRHICNTVLIDGEEDYSKTSSSVAGLPELIQKFQEAVAGVVDMPLTIFVGKSAGSLSATGDNEIRAWYDKINSDQNNEILDQLNRLIRLILLSSESSDEIKLIEGWSVTFNPLWMPSESESITSKKMQAETDAIYIDRGVLFPEEVAVSRFGGSAYSFETKLSEGSRENMAINSESNQ